MEQYFLNDLRLHRSIFKCIDLCGVKVLEIGCGHGEITEPLLNSGAITTAYEIDPDLTKKLSHDNLMLKHEYFSKESSPNSFDAVISNPPYSLLEEISEYIKEHNIKNYLIMSSEKKRHYFSDSIIVGKLSCESFYPHPKNTPHYILGGGIFKDLFIKNQPLEILILAEDVKNKIISKSETELTLHKKRLFVIETISNLIEEGNLCLIYVIFKRLIDSIELDANRKNLSFTEDVFVALCSSTSIFKKSRVVKNQDVSNYPMFQHICNIRSKLMKKYSQLLSMVQEKEKAMEEIMGFYLE